MAKVPRFAEASAGRWPIVEMDNRTATSSSISVLQQPVRCVHYGLIPKSLCMELPLSQLLMFSNAASSS